MKWNANLYQNNHSFVAEYGKDLLNLINLDNTQTILDLGCGTGELTYELSKNNAKVIGIDASESMITSAKSNFPNLDFSVADATNLPYENYFDTIFSNAVFHWIPNQKELLESIYNSLKETGTLICEFGAYGNIQNIETAFTESIKQFQKTYTSTFFFPTVAYYSDFLKSLGYKIKFIKDFDRPTELKDGKNGLRNWVTQFFAGKLTEFTEEERLIIFENMEKILSKTFWNGKYWIADYRRIQVLAIK